MKRPPVFPSAPSRRGVVLPTLSVLLCTSLAAQNETPPPPAPAQAPAIPTQPPQLPANLQPGATTPKAPNSDPANNAAGALFDNRLPMLDPSGGLLRFNGQTWDIQNNAIFRARFEKFLNTPEENGEDERAHRETLNKMIALLDPNNLKPQTLTDAYRLLARAAGYPGDSRLCDTLANAIYSVWGVKRNQARMEEANQILEQENKRLRHNMAVRASGVDFQESTDGKTGKSPQGTMPDPQSSSPSNSNPSPAPSSGTPGSVTLSNNSTSPNASSAPGGTPSSGGSGNSSNATNLKIQLPGAPSTPTPADGTDSAGKGSSAAQSALAGQSSKAIQIAGYAEKLMENSARVKANSLKGDLSEMGAKIEYQSLLVQLFMQRRFHHVIIGTRFYRALFGDGDSRLNLPESSQSPFTKGSGLPMTIATLESLANEAMREVQTGVQAFHKLLDLGEIRSASERLRDALLVGEFMPEVRTVPFERKRRVLAFVSKSNQLLSALEVKDYTLASDLLNGPTGLRSVAPDLDVTKAVAMIDTARNAARLLLAKARNSAISGDKSTFEATLKEAAAIWPNNPELAEVAAKAFNQGDQMAQTLLELDQLVAQKNLRRIYDDAGRFLAATQTAPPEKQMLLKKILDDYKSIEASLMAAQEMDRLGNSAGAWESVERVAQKFPDDLQLNQARALYTTKAADFVRTVQTAQEREKREELAPSVAWYLKAQRLYPKSDLAEQALKRLKGQLVPEVAH